MKVQILWKTFLALVVKILYFALFLMYIVNVEKCKVKRFDNIK